MAWADSSDVRLLKHKHRSRLIREQVGESYREAALAAGDDFASIIIMHIVCGKGGEGLGRDISFCLS